jgi:hypothetical protein
MKAATVDEIRHGPYKWRLKKVAPRDMAVHGVSAMMILQEVMDPARAKAEQGAKPRSITRMSEKQRELMVKGSEKGAALVCAAVTHVKADGGDWEEVQLVMRREQDTSDGTIHVDDIPPGTANVLFHAAMSLSAPDEVAKRIATFRRVPRTPEGATEDVPDVRQVAP